MILSKSQAVAIAQAFPDGITAVSMVTRDGATIVRRMSATARPALQVLDQGWRVGEEYDTMPEFWKMYGLSPKDYVNEEPQSRLLVRSEAERLLTVACQLHHSEMLTLTLADGCCVQINHKRQVSIKSASGKVEAYASVADFRHAYGI